MSSYRANSAKMGNPNTCGTYNNEMLVTWSTSVEDKIMMHVGDGWGDVPLASEAQIENIEAQFAEQTPF
jgi:carboxylesterase 2